MSKDINTIGRRIRKCRKELGYSQETIAEMLYMKKNTISRYENDEHDIPSSNIVALAEVLHTSPNYLLLGDTNESEWIEDLITVIGKIKTPEYKQLVKKQIAMIAELEK